MTSVSLSQIYLTQGTFDKAEEAEKAIAQAVRLEPTITLASMLPIISGHPDLKERQKHIKILEELWPK